MVIGVMVLIIRIWFLLSVSFLLLWIFMLVDGVFLLRKGMFSISFIFSLGCSLLKVGSVGMRICCAKVGGVVMCSCWCS